MSKPLTLSQDGDWTIIAARPSPMPKRGPIIAVLLPAFLCVFLIINVSVGAGLVIWLLVSSLIFAWLSYVNRKKRKGKLPPFAVKRDALRLPDGEVIPKNRLYRLGIRNTENGGVYFYGGNTLQRAAAIGAASTQQRMMETSFAVVPSTTARCLTSPVVLPRNLPLRCFMRSFATWTGLLFLDAGRHPWRQA